MVYIKKRDGRKVKFNEVKIEDAIKKAFKAVDGDVTEFAEIKASNIASYIYSKAKEDELSVEEIQDYVEKGLMSTKRKDVAKAYITYRNNRTYIREKKSPLITEVQEKLAASNVQNQNANVDEHSFGGRKGEADSTMMKHIALYYIMSEKSRNNHLNNRIYVHDLDSYAVGMHNCFRSDTEFITNEGVKAFKDFEDGSIVQVLDKDGQWREATVKCYGRQAIQKVTFIQSFTGKTKEVWCTPNHRWILQNGEVTTSLKTRDVLYSNIPYLWTVESIEREVYPTKAEEVWCVEEPVTHSFTLSDGIVTGNCMSIPFDDLLKNGFNTRQTDIRPANSINTALQLVAVLFQLQSLQQFGGASATHLDWTMVPYVRKSFMKHYISSWMEDREEFLDLDLMDMLFDIYEERIKTPKGYTLIVYRNKFDDWIDQSKQLFFEKTGLVEKDFYLDNHSLDRKYYQKALFRTIRETQQSVEALYHNLNSLQSRSGNQLPFTSINYGTCTSTEGRLIIKALLDGSIKGIGALHRTPIFPCGIFQVGKGINKKPGDPNYDLFKLAIKSTSRRLYPNYCNIDWSGNAGYDKNDPRTYMSTMGCRTANGKDINGFGQLKDGRGNICPVTIIMPTLAMEAKEKAEENGTDIVEEFMNILDDAIADAKDMLIERFNHIASQPSESAKFMYENNIMAGYVPEEGIVSALKHGTLAVGQLGLAETLQILIHTNQISDEGLELAKRIEQLFKDRCNEYKEEYKLNFGVYHSPSENLCYTSMKKFKNQYGEIENVSDKEFFTNSTHVPVWEEIDPFEKINIESQLASYSSAGSICYIELDSTVIQNTDAIESFVQYAMDHDVPYFAINVPNDTCLECGYTGEFDTHCPVCGSEHIQQLRRVTGLSNNSYGNAPQLP